MSDRFSRLVRDYVDQVLPLSARMYRCSPAQFLLAVPLFLFNQVSFVLAFMLPLKVIILLGTDGVPRYFEFFMTEQSRGTWMVLLAAGAIASFALYLASGEILSRLGDRASRRIQESSGKAGLFDDQERFASDVFLRVIGLWGTVSMAAGGAILGLVLEWRLVVLLGIAIALEFAFFAVYWNRFSRPERAGARDRLVQRRMSWLHNLSGVNVLILFVGLVVLLLTDAGMNFIVAVLLFLLTRQVLARLVRVFGDANFFLQNSERIDALVHPERQLRERRSSERDRFEQLLMPEHRERLVRAISAAAELDVGDLDWEWRDLNGKGAAMFVGRHLDATREEYRLKITMREGDAALARELMFYSSESASVLGASCDFVEAGSVFGRGFILLRSPPLVTCPQKRLQDVAFQLRMRLWRHEPDSTLVSSLLRSFPPLEERLSEDRLSRIRLACNRPADDHILDRFLNVREDIVNVVQNFPKVLVNSAIFPDNVLLTEDDLPILLNWAAVRYDVIGSDLLPRDLKTAYSPEKLASGNGVGALPKALPRWSLPLVVHLCQLDRQIQHENYGAALSAVRRVMDAFRAADRDKISRRRFSV